MARGLLQERAAVVGGGLTTSPDERDKMKLLKPALSALMVLAVLLVATAASADTTTAKDATYRAGEVVDVEWKGKWYEGKILEAKEGRYKIHYVGWDKKWDEWVGADRLRTRLAVGAKVQVKWKGRWYPAVILEVKDAKYKIHYEGYESSWDEWVTQARIKR